MLDTTSMPIALRSATTPESAGEGGVPTTSVMDRLFDRVSELLCVLDVDMVIRRVNPAMADLLGSPMSEIAGCAVARFIHPEDAADVETLGSEIRAGRHVQQIEVRCRQADGGYRWTVWSVIGDLERGLLYGMGRDVHEAHEESARARHLAAIVDASSDAVIGIDPAGQITSWNPAANRIYGWSAERILGRPIQTLFDKSAGATLENILSELHRGRAVDVSGARHVREDGREVIASVSLAPVRDASGRLVGGSLIARDITERHRARAAIVAGENRFRAAIDQAPVPIMIHDTDGKVLHVSQTWTRLSGYTAAELPTLNHWARRALPSGAAAIKPLFAPDAEQTEPVQVQLHTASGETRTWILTSGPLGTMGDGKAARMIAAMDITDSRRATDERDRFFHLSADMLCVFDLKGYLQRINPPFIKLTGHEPSLLTRRPFIEFIHRDDRPIAIMALRKLARGETTADMEHRFRCHDGMYRRLAWHVSLEPVTGLLYAVVRDVTHERQEQARRDELIEVAQQRVRAFTTLHNVSRLLLSDNEAEVFQQVVAMLPGGMRHPELIGARMCVGLDRYATPDFRVTPWLMQQAFLAEGVLITIEVSYGEAPPCDPPFHAEERTLLESVADMLKGSIESHRRDRRLVASENQFRSMVSGLPGAVYRCQLGEGWHMAYISEAIKQITGLEASVFMGPQARCLADLIHPDDAPRNAVLVSDAVADRRPYDLTYRIRRTDGAVRWVHESGRPVYTDAGRLASLDGVMFDITDQISTDHTRRATESDYRTLFDLTGAAHLQLEPGTLQVRRGNQKFYDMLDLEAHTVPGRPMIELVHPADQPTFQSHMDQLHTEGGAAFQLDLRMLRSDGTVIWARIAAALGHDDEGNALHVSVVVEDISAEQRSRRAVEDLRAVIGTAFDTRQSLIACDLTGRLMFINGTADGLLRENTSRPDGDRELASWLTESASPLKGALNGQSVVARPLPGRSQGVFSIAPLRLPDGRIIGAAVLVTHVPASDPAASVAAQRETLRRIVGGLEGTIQEIPSAPAEQSATADALVLDEVRRQIGSIADLVRDAIVPDSPFRPTAFQAPVMIDAATSDPPTSTVRSPM